MLQAWSIRTCTSSGCGRTPAATIFHFHFIPLVHVNVNNKSPSQKATQAYELYDKGKKHVEVAIQLGLSENISHHS